MEKRTSDSRAASKEQSPWASRLRFDNRFVRELPADANPLNARRQVLGACYSHVQPQAASKPALIAHAREVLELLDLPEDAASTELFAQVFAGSAQLADMQPIALCYGGHQFGSWAGQLGDGRAITLGEVINAKGERWELQLKGAGPTPYSRMGDGFAVMRSSVREFLCSEAMHHLGVPTTRALSLVATGDMVVRDMFYDGHAKQEPGAVVCRVAPSFIRFGNFQILAARGETELLKKLVNFTIRRDFPQLCSGELSAEVYAAWVAEVCRLTAHMISEWMRVGFVHGVMNTDNMSVLGLTIDYGPYGWLENYDPYWTPNTTDASGRRYCFGHQPHIALWNLERFAESIAPLVGRVEPLEEAMDVYSRTLSEAQSKMMASKLGIQSLQANDTPLIEGLFAVLQSAEIDMTIFFRNLANVPVHEANGPLRAAISDAYYTPDTLTEAQLNAMEEWLQSYARRVREDGLPHATRQQRMNRVNPKYVLRNYLAQLAIDKAEQGDGTMIGTLLNVLRRPYDEQPEHETFAAKRPEWARHRPGCSMLSCSS